MHERGIDPAYLRYQYGDAEKLRVRIESHARYSERRDSFVDWLLERVAPAPGVLLDVGCGSGVYHRAVAARGMRIVALDLSPGMLRAVRDQAREHRLPVLAARGDAQRLPVRDASCDRIMANNMLYHVPDRLAALREFRRALNPGGRVVLATNARDTMARLWEVHRAAAERLGYAAAPLGVGDRFSLDDLPLIRAVFLDAERHVREDAFVFPDAEAALRYYATGPIDAIADPPADGGHRARLLPVVAEQIREIIAREGAFRVPKTSGCFVAVVGRGA